MKFVHSSEKDFVSIAEVIELPGRNYGYKFDQQ
jgi:hypothetical protein